MLFHIVSGDFTAARGCSKSKAESQTLHRRGILIRLFDVRVFDLSILFDAPSSSFPPHFNKDKTESAIVAAKSLSHENTKSFMSDAEWKIKLIYFCGLWVCDAIACFKCILFVVVCVCVLSVCVECVPAWPCAHTCTYILLSLLLLSESSTFVCLVRTRPPACGCVSRKEVSAAHSWSSGVCFLTGRYQTITCGCELFMDLAFVWKKEQRCLSRYTRFV